MSDKPPFRAGHVGSLLRPGVHRARADFDAGVVSRAALTAVEDAAIDLVVRRAVEAFHAAGCRYLRFDDVNLAYLCDPSSRALIRARGDDPDALLAASADMANAAIAGRPSDMVITTHLCRGNFRSTWFAEGGYEPVAEALFRSSGRSSPPSWISRAKCGPMRD